MNMKKIEKWCEFSINSHLYKISNKGNIQTFYNNEWRPMKTSVNKKGYKRVGLCDKKHYFIHRLVAKAFVPNPNNLPQVNHKNGIKDCNEDWNLEWCDNSYNYNHAIKNGLKDMKLASNHAIKKTSKPVIQLTLDNKVVKTWNSMMDAERTLGISNSHISACCKHKKGFYTAGGYKWEYLERELIGSE